MKKTEPSSSRPDQNPGSSPRSEASTSLQSPVLPTGSYHPLPIKMLERRLTELRDEDFARWGAYTLEDLGIIEVDRVIGSAAGFGRKIRERICIADGSELKTRWRKIATRILFDSPGTNNPSALMATICMIAANEVYVEGILDAKEAQ